MGVLARVGIRPDAPVDDTAYFWQLPAVRTLWEEPLELDPGVTVLVGENGSGKSTLVEAIAFAWSRRLTAAVKHWGPQPGTEDAELYRALALDGEWPPPQGGCFLRAEAMHQHFAGVDRDDLELRAFEGRALNARSHGEGFLAFLESRRFERGLYLLDEPEAALSFRSCLSLIALLGDAIAAGSQVVMATHSPVLAAFPDARLLQLDNQGITATTYDDLGLVRDWREFLAGPSRFLRYLID
jgi:predicted ATPase